MDISPEDYVLHYKHHVYQIVQFLFGNDREGLDYFLSKATCLPADSPFSFHHEIATKSITKGYISLSPTDARAGLFAVKEGWARREINPQFFIQDDDWIYLYSSDLLSALMNAAATMSPPNMKLLSFLQKPNSPEMSWEERSQLCQEFINKAIEFDHRVFLEDLHLLDSGDINGRILFDVLMSSSPRHREALVASTPKSFKNDEEEVVTGDMARYQAMNLSICQWSLESIPTGRAHRLIELGVDLKSYFESLNHRKQIQLRQRLLRKCLDADDINAFSFGADLFGGFELVLRACLPETLVEMTALGAHGLLALLLSIDTTRITSFISLSPAAHLCNVVSPRLYSAPDGPNWVERFRETTKLLMSFQSIHSLFIKLTQSHLNCSFPQNPPPGSFQRALSDGTCPVLDILAEVLKKENPTRGTIFTCPNYQTALFLSSFNLEDYLNQVLLQHVGPGCGQTQLLAESLRYILSQQSVINLVDPNSAIFKSPPSNPLKLIKSSNQQTSGKGVYWPIPMLMALMMTDNETKALLLLQAFLRSRLGSTKASFNHLLQTNPGLDGKTAVTTPLHFATLYGSYRARRFGDFGPDEKTYNDGSRLLDSMIGHYVDAIALDNHVGQEKYLNGIKVVQ